MCQAAISNPRDRCYIDIEDKTWGIEDISINARLEYYLCHEW